MKIRYKKKRLRINFLIVIAWGILFVLTAFFISQRRWTDYVNIVLFFFYTINFIYEYKNQYLTIADDTITKNLLFQTKKMNLNEIIQVKNFAGDYILKTSQKELIINTQIINPDSLIDLNAVLEQLELPPDRTPFARAV
ncbi:hypothetical protein [Zobellia sp. B3R18]|uniref:hypothetical protein n=1 Tax=Zobellia sp. B3R18 TaxID=2841568 RepID=UPI001C06D540|nr:hypothetical protein [Zobellia sp. B3R18]MBU2972855.1 hypothetical protein [Zobellia sp. B3R18]